MSKLRKKLRQARHEYQHERYAGDLADDLLSRPDVIAQLTPTEKPSHLVRALALAAALAIVAAAGIVLVNSNNRTGPNVAMLTRSENPVVVAPTTTPAGSDMRTTSTTGSATIADTKQTEPAVEERLSLVPSEVASSQEMSFSLVPSLSSMSSTATDSTEGGTVHE